jgi:hypothetical protein
VFMGTGHTKAALFCRSSAAALICCSAQLAPAAIDDPTFQVHGSGRTCSSITQLDSALANNAQSFFAGWTEQDYADAMRWSQACAQFGWHVPDRPRMKLLQAQHDRALGAAAPPPAAAAAAAPQADTAAAGATPAAIVAAPSPSAAPPSAAPPASAPPATATGAETAPSAPLPGAAAGAPTVAAAQGQPLFPPVAPAPAAGGTLGGQLLVPASPGIPISGGTASTGVAAPTADAAAAVPLPIAPAPGSKSSDAEADSLVTDDFMKHHFHEEALWVAGKAHLDIGSDRGASGWLESGTSAQMKNRITADRIVLYCARKTMSAETDKRPLLWDWRWCESEEAAAYNRLVSGNEFPSAGRSVVLGCANVESYVHVERCIATLTEPPNS